MTFSELGLLAQCYVMGLYIVCFTLLIMLILAYLLLYKDKKTVLPMVVFLIFTVIENAAMKEINHYPIIQNTFTNTSKFLNQIPTWLLVIYGIFIIIYCIYYTYKLLNYRKTNLNPFSIKEAIENLPTGIAFTTKDGSLLLSNRVFNKLSYLLTHKDLQNGEEFWNDLTTLQNSKLCTTQGKEPIFELHNGEIWQFSKSTCIIDKKECTELKADNITEIHILSQNLQEVNTKLLNQQKVLRDLFTNIEYNVSEQIALNMRINFHDQFGNLTTLTKKSLNENITTEKTDELIKSWDNMTNSIDICVSKEYINTLSLVNIKDFAKKLSCELFIAGELPKEEDKQQIMLLAINEMLKNAVYHAKAKRLFVNLKTDNTNYILEIKNINTHKLSELKEGGGLSGLRKKTEQANGNMHIILDENVTLRIKLIRNS